MLKEAVLSKNADTICKYASMINSSSVQTFRLLENLLEWSGSQRGNITLNPEKIWVNELISEEIGMVDDMAGRKNIEIVCLVSEALYITTDKNMLRTILRNLITNAVKFTHKNGRIIIKAGDIKNHLEISVSDNGIGMTKEIISKLFRIDSNLSTRGTDDEKGTGLGLVLCREFVGKLGGNIRAESEVGKGSTFTVTLPPEF
jgi:signal transduction histidine kinase